MYFSRSVIPFVRDDENTVFYKHIGLYAYKYSVLKSIANMPESSLEIAEKLEQLRWLQNGYSIKICEVSTENIAVDTAEDLILANEFAKSNSL